MKTITRIIAAVTILLNVSFANELSYKLIISNIIYTSGNSLEFDIYLLNAGSNEFRYSLGQYFLEFNPEIANDGALTYSIVNSDLPETMRPRNPSVSGSQLRLAVNAVSSNRDNLPVIPAKPPGLLIARMRLETSAKKFVDEELDLKWSSGKLQTKVFALVDSKNVEVTNSENNSIEVDNPTGGITQDNTQVPKEFSLSQNYPNPFNPVTQIKYALPKDGIVSLKVFDITGREVKTILNEFKPAGYYTSEFDGSNLASGMYFYRIVSGDFVNTKKMVLVK